MLPSGKAANRILIPQQLLHFIGRNIQGISEKKLHGV